MKNTDPQHWTARQSADLYRIDDWGAGYFGLCDSGEVTVSAPFGDNRARVKLNDIIAGIRERVTTRRFSCA